MRYVTESMIDMFRAQGSSSGFALRGHRLMSRSRTATSPVRAAMLECMAEAYISGGLALEHRLHGSVEMALKLEEMTDGRLELARRYFQGKVEV